MRSGAAGAMWMKSLGDVDETGAKVRRAAWVRPRGGVDEIPGRCG